jgi:hypothetical protein
MQKFRNPLTIALLAGAALAVPCAMAQSAPPAQDNSYQGVSTPPSDDAIIANPDTPATQPKAKPSPAVPVTQPKPASNYAPSQPYSSSSTTRIAQPSNPDYGVVGDHPANAQAGPANPDEGMVTDAPALATRHPDAGIVEVVHSPSNELAEGTNIHVRLLQGLSTTDTTVGTPFRGQVTADVSKEGRVVIPQGSEMRGRVVSVKQGHHFGIAATLRLRPDTVILPDGTAYHLYGQVIASHASGTRTDSEGGISPKAQTTRNVVAYGAGAGTGAVVGAEVAGPGGALVGSLVGAGVITAHLMLQHPQAARVPVDSVVVFSLTEPMDLLPTRN